MSDLQAVTEDFISGVDVEECGKALRVASNTPHLISLGCDRLSTSVTIHPLRQGRVTLGSNQSSDIVLHGTGVYADHARIENSNDVVTLYPINGVTTIDGTKVENPTRLSQGCMIGIGRSNYLRFNHPAEANLMKSVLPNTRISMAPIQFLPSESTPNQNFNDSEQYEKIINSFNKVTSYQAQNILDSELEMINNEVRKKKPPVAPRRMFRDIDQASNSSSSDQENKNEVFPKSGSIMSKVSKFEYYVKNSQRTKNTSEVWSPKVFSANSQTVNVPANEVLVGKNVPCLDKKPVPTQRTVMLNENNAVDPRACMYTNVTLKTQTGKIDEISKQFDSNRNQRSNDQVRPRFKIQTPSPCFNRNPIFSNASPSSERSFFSSENSSSYNSRDRVHFEDHKSMEMVRIDEILNLCAEYEKQHSTGTPTTPTEKKHNKIITNGSLPRGYQVNPNIVPSGNGYFKIETINKEKTVLNSPIMPKSPVNSSQIHYGSYDSNKSYYEVSQLEQNHLNDKKQDMHKQFPITELSSPVMIRKIARNAQNTSNYVSSFDRSQHLNLNINNKPFSPYENIPVQLNGSGFPKSPNSGSPRTRIRTTYAHKNPTSPQHFIFPSPPIEKSQVIDKKFDSLFEDIPMIDDMNFANELEIRISKLKPENRELTKESLEKFIIEPLENALNGQYNREMERDIIADIPEFDAINRDFENNLNPSKNDNADLINDSRIDVVIKADVTVAKNDDKPIENDYSNQLESLYAKRKQIMNDMKETKTDINDFELSMKQNELELDDFEIRQKTLQERIEKYQQQRQNEVETAIVSEAEKLNFKQAQEERAAEMREMQRKLDDAEALVKNLEKKFSKGLSTLEELRHAQELLENERKLFEDMEFQHLEKESEFFSRLSKEQNVLQNDPWGTCKKINRLEEFVRENDSQFKLSKSTLDEKRASNNPDIKRLIDKLDVLENNLHDVNSQINDIKKESGIYRLNENDLEDRKARIKSGDFSPPTSDDDDMNEIKSRIKSLNDEHAADLDVFEQKTEADIDLNTDDKVNVDPMSMSMIVETQTELHDLFDDSNKHSPYKTTVPEKQYGSESPEISDKKGFWERNFDSLSRLKSKEKKNKSKNDIMSQSFNENMFYNNENIESEFGAFDKNASKKPIPKPRDLSKNKNEDSSKSKISTLTSLGKIMRSNSLGKKNKDGSKRGNDKENMDVNTDTAEKMDESKDDQKVKHRYLKNSKVNVDNKYTNKSSKINQNDVKTPESEVKKPNFNNTIPICENISKTMFRKSAGDEIKKKYGETTLNFCDSTKIPSQDDIDRISKIALDAPIFSNNSDMNTLGRKTLDSLRELERNRVAMLEQKGCEVIENEREKMSELKKRIQNETLMKWEENQLRSAKNHSDSPDLISNENSIPESTNQDESGFDTTDDQYRNSLDCSSVIEGGSSPDKQLRHSQTDSYTSSPQIDDERIYNGQSSPLSIGATPQRLFNDVRPLSEVSDLSSDGVSALVEGVRRKQQMYTSNSANNTRRMIKNREDMQRPLTRYLPIENDELNLRIHIESAGHQVDICPHITIDSTSCRGYLHKLGAKFHGWSKRWFVFDRLNKTFIYYSDKNEKKPRGGAYFQVIEEVYMDHLNASKSPTPLTTFVVKTRQRRYYLMAPSGPAARIWIDVIFTGAQGYTEYMQ